MWWPWSSSSSEPGATTAQPVPAEPDPLPKPSSVRQPEDYKKSFQRRQTYTQKVDPCAAATKASLACMEQNDFDRESCHEYFKAYRDCSKRWQDRRKADRRKGIEWDSE